MADDFAMRLDELRERIRAYQAKKPFQPAVDILRVLQRMEMHRPRPEPAAGVSISDWQAERDEKQRIVSQMLDAWRGAAADQDFVHEVGLDLRDVIEEFQTGSLPESSRRRRATQQADKKESTTAKLAERASHLFRLRPQPSNALRFDTALHAARCCRPRLNFQLGNHGAEFFLHPRVSLISEHVPEVFEDFTRTNVFVYRDCWHDRLRYAAAPGGPTRSVAFDLNGASFDFGVNPIGLGNVAVNSADPFNGGGSITLQVTKAGANYDIGAGATINLTIHDVFDFHYFRVLGFKAEWGDVRFSPPMIQSGFGKPGSHPNAGKVGLVEVKVDGSVTINGRLVTP